MAGKPAQLPAAQKALNVIIKTYKILGQQLTYNDSIIIENTNKRNYGGKENAFY